MARLQAMYPPPRFEVKWNPRDQEDMEHAKQVFREFRKNGYVPYRLKNEGEELVREFEPRLVPRLGREGDS